MVLAFSIPNCDDPVTYNNLIATREKRDVHSDSRQRRSDLSLPPASTAVGRRSLWPLGHGVTVDLGPRRWEGSALYFESFVLNF
jgi:hypothetical protein